MKASVIFKLALAVAVIATPVDMCGQGLLKKLGQGLQKVLAPSTTTTKTTPTKTTTSTNRTPVATTPRIVINKTHQDVLLGDMLIRPYGEIPNCQFQFIMARREASVINVYFNLINKNNLTVNNVCMRNYGENAVVYGDIPQQKSEVQGFRLGDKSSTTEVAVNIPANGKVMGCISINGTVSSNLDETISNISINFSATVEGVERQFGYLLHKAPLTQFILRKGGFATFDYTKPISQFPKSVFGLYDNFTVETSYNEVEDYESTFVTFTLNGQKVMEGESDSEGDVKVLSRLTAYSPIIYTLRGVYPGMSVEKAYATGAIFWREGWFEGIREPGYWMMFDGGGWTAAGQQKYLKASEDYENRLNYDENAKWRGAITAKDFTPGTYISNITFYF